MCTEVQINRLGAKPVFVSTVRELSEYFPVIVCGSADREVNRLATHCLCPVDIRESAKQSGYTITDEPGFAPDFIVEQAPL